MTTVAAPPKTIRLIAYEDILARCGRTVEEVECTPGVLLGTVLTIAAKRRGWDPGGCLATVNGQPVRGDRSIPISPGDEVIYARSPGDPVDAVLIAIAIISVATSAYLITQVKSPRIAQESGREQERHFRFSRLSRPAVVGDAKPVLLGERIIGGKVISRRPLESVDGSGDSKLRILLDLGAGRFDAIGNVTSDADGVSATDLADIEVQDQPIANFPGFKAWVRMGTANQAPIQGFSDVDLVREVGVGGVEMRNSSGTERTGPSPSGEAYTFSTLNTVHSVTIRCRFPGLFTVSDQGQVDIAEVKYRYRWRLSDVGAGAGVWSAFTVVHLKRADQNEFFSSPRLDLFTGSPAKVDIQLERVSVEPVGVSTISRFFWDSVVETTTANKSYPKRALLALELTAGEQISTQPEISVRCRGLRCRVWDGVSPPTAPVFVTQFTRNPYWHALEIHTNTDWGDGQPDSTVDFATLFAEAPFADAMVPRPGGGTRPRFACDMLLDTQREPNEWLRTVLRTARAQPLWVGNVLRVVSDRARSAVERFTDGSIAVDAENKTRLTYRREATTGGIVRPNQLLAQFDDRINRFQPDTIAYPQDGELWLATEPRRQKTLRLEGITDRDQLASELVYLTKRERFLSRSVRFVTTKPMIAVQPQDRFELATSVIGWGLASGRLGAGTLSSVKLDRSVTISAGVPYSVEVTHEDGSVELRSVVNPAGLYPAGVTLTVSPAFSTAPKPLEEYAFGQTGIQTKPFTCTGVAPAGEAGGGIMWEISGVEYADDVYDDTAATVTLPTYSTLTSGQSPPGPVTDLVAYERMVAGVNQVELAWGQTPDDAQITAWFWIYRRKILTDAWVKVPDAKVSRRGAVIEVRDSDQAYDFCVVAVSIGGAALSPYDPRVPKATLTFGLDFFGPEPPGGTTPTAVLSRNPDGTYKIEWPPVTGAVQYAVLISGDGPSTVAFAKRHHSQVFARVTPPRIDGLTLAPNRPYSFYVRTVAASNRMSSSAAFTQTTLGHPALKPGQSVKDTKTYTLASEGTRTNLAWDGTDLRLELVDATGPGVWLGPDRDTGSLTLTELSFRAHTSNDASDPTLASDPFKIPSIAADQWGTIDGLPDEPVGMIWPPYPDNEVKWLFEVRTHDGTVWSDWSAIAPCAAIKRVFRRYQFRATLSRLNPPYRPALAAITVVCTH